MAALQWVWIIAGTVVGTFAPVPYLVVALVSLLMGYAACFSLQWLRLQWGLAYLFGGLATGFGLQLGIRYGMQDQPVPMLIVPLLTWLVLRVVFYALETKYTLTPNAAVAQMRLEDAQAINGHTDPDPTLQDVMVQQGTSAWQDKSHGMAAQVGPDGYTIGYDYESTGEIAMGGPTYGNVVFNNRCAIADVGPSIVLSEDGHYAVMMRPSRDVWQTLVLDLVDKVLYETSGDHCFWELDSVKHGVVSGRVSPLTSNQPVQAMLEALLQGAKRSPLVQDDGWWVNDYAGRQPLPKYEAVTLYSQTKQHRVTFVPDLKPFKDNPFKRYQPPIYAVLVDDVLQSLEVRQPTAVWVNGVSSAPHAEGRFLVVDWQVLDFLEAEYSAKRIAKPEPLSIELGDRLTSIGATACASAGDAQLRVTGSVHPRSTGWSQAEFVSYSTTYPWDEEAEYIYWDADGNSNTQVRTRIVQYVEYHIDLPKLSEQRQLALCARILRTSRANPQHHAEWQCTSDKANDALYLPYTLTTSCGIRLEHMTLEAIWSHCGRYLAVVHYEAAPDVPHRISVIDVETANVKALPNTYALPSFIWFDRNMLELTHIVAVQETINYGYDKLNDEKTLRLNDPNSPKNRYGWLLTDRAKRQAELEQLAQQGKTGDHYAGASVDLIAQHCILFAPHFDHAVLQAPTT
jgi:hypothetical protein